MKILNKKLEFSIKSNFKNRIIILPEIAIPKTFIKRIGEGEHYSNAIIGFKIFDRYIAMDGIFSFYIFPFLIKIYIEND